MTWERKRWRSEWEIPPGQFILDALEELGTSEQELAEALSMDDTQFKALIDGVSAVTDETAHKLARVTGKSAQTWMQIQLDYDRAVTNNRSKRDTGADTFIYRIDDEFGRPVEYGTATDLAEVVTRHPGIGEYLSLDQVADRLHPDVAERKLAKLERAFRNRKEREAAGARSAVG